MSALEVTLILLVLLVGLANVTVGIARHVYPHKLAQRERERERAHELEVLETQREILETEARRRELEATDPCERNKHDWGPWSKPKRVKAWLPDHSGLWIWEVLQERTCQRCNCLGTRAEAYK